MNKEEIKLARKYLKRVSSSEVSWLKESLKTNALLDYRLFPEFEGIYTLSCDNGTYEFLFTFKKECIDNNIAMFLDEKLNEAIDKAKGKKIYVVCDIKQITLCQLLCKKDFKKAHRGLEYKILTKNIECLKQDKTISMKDYNKNDEEKYLNAICEAFKYQDLKSNETSNHETTKKYWEEEIFDNKNYSFYSFFEKDELIGFVVFNNQLLDYLIVNPKYQGKGYGEYILKKSLLEYTKAKKYKWINLYTYLINLKARKLYEKVGFKMVGQFCMNHYINDNK